ncbi:Bulb-type lectin domain-containing protein [Abeliophyllum distichum]|uniref:Bulb-type lectin domain-containing protein n=1 Tax=Abeliophyllum distichum TaxID=126358 RepID=A0ABD1UGC3_9LAMI
MEIFHALFFQFFLLYLLSGFCIAADTLNSSMTISYGETLVSSGQSFELGLFSPRNSSKWYKEFPEIVVWVANPLPNAVGVLLTVREDLILMNVHQVLLYGLQIHREVNQGQLQSYWNRHANNDISCSHARQREHDTATT